MGYFVSICPCRQAQVTSTEDIIKSLALECVSKNRDAKLAVFVFSVQQVRDLTYRLAAVDVTCEIYKSVRRGGVLS